MKKTLIFFILISIVISTHGQRNRKKSAPTPETPAFVLSNAEDSLAYAIGVLNYQSLNEELIKRYNLELKMDVLTKGMLDLCKDTVLLDPAQANEFLGIYMMKKESEGSKAEEAAGRKFLEENKSRAGMAVTPTGLQYEIISLGTGPKPKATDRVKVHYTGTLIDGTVFDSSVERGEPIVFGLNQVIPGWTEGLQLMPTGSKFRLYIPSELGYGARSAGALIKPNSVLIFDVELISIEP